MILQIIMRLFLSCITITEGVLDDSSVDAENVDEVIMVGGSTGTPWLRAKIASMFNRVRLLTMVHSGANDLIAAGVMYVDSPRPCGRRGCSNTGSDSGRHGQNSLAGMILRQYWFFSNVKYVRVRMY